MTDKGIFEMTKKNQDAKTDLEKLNRRDLLLAGAGATLTAATLAGAPQSASALGSDGEVLYQSSAGSEIPLPETFISDHFTNGVHPPKIEMPAPLTAPVTADNPLEYDLYWSMRSPYSYLALDRILALNEHYNVKMNFMPTLPIAVKFGGFPGAPWYRWNYDMVDQHRVAKRLGIPFRRPRPEVVIQDTWPPYEVSLNIPIGEQNQPYVYLISRCAVAAKMQDKGGAFLDHVSHMMWDGTVDDWPEHLAEYMNHAGMDGEAVLADIKADPKKYDNALDDVNKAKSKTGSGGVPEMVFRGEPFFGQDMFDSFFWRLAENGLTRKDGGSLPAFTNKV
jgi:2-hydroxychromene-2-carboxylate isomerase